MGKVAPPPGSTTADPKCQPGSQTLLRGLDMLDAVIDDFNLQ